MSVWEWVFVIFVLGLNGLFIGKAKSARRRERKAQEAAGNVTELGALIGTADDLKRAEAELKQTSLELREKILQDHRLYGRFSTTKGFSVQYMEDLVRDLHQEGIHSTYVFQETLPVGTLTVTNSHGVFELYVEREKYDEADRFLRRRFGH